MRRKSILMGGLLLGLLAVGGSLVAENSEKEEHVHYHAGFSVYIDGVKQDYSDFKYMNFTPCSEHDEAKSKEEEQIEKAHLHDSVGDVVHVHRSGAKWGDLFKNINVSLPNDLPILSKNIEPNSSVVITIGEPIANPTKVSMERIQEVEAKSELCGSN